jgi:hypothetical protein
MFGLPYVENSSSYMIEFWRIALNKGNPFLKIRDLVSDPFKIS